MGRGYVVQKRIGAWTNVSARGRNWEYTVGFYDALAKTNPRREYRIVRCVDGVVTDRYTKTDRYTLEGDELEAFHA